jgi:hypothetical protein
MVRIFMVMEAFEDMRDGFMIRSVSLLLVVLLGACAGQPQASSTPPDRPHKVKVDASNVVAVQHAGYKLRTDSNFTAGPK